MYSFTKYNKMDFVVQTLWTIARDNFTKDIKGGKWRMEDYKKLCASEFEH